MWEESRTESFRCQHHLQTEVILSGPSFGCTNKQRVQLEANVILKIQQTTEYKKKALMDKKLVVTSGERDGRGAK